MSRRAGDERARIVRALRNAAVRLERADAAAPPDLRMLAALASALDDALDTPAAPAAPPAALPRARLLHDLRSASGTLLTWCYLFRRGVSDEQAAHGIGVMEATILRLLPLVERLAETPARPRRGGADAPAAVTPLDVVASASSAPAPAASADASAASAATARPATAPGASAPGAPGAATADLAGLRILIVDDDADARDSMRAMLAAHGADVATAVSATDAFDVLQQGRPDVLISDIVMPDADGYALLRRVRAPDTGERGLIPAIAVTGRARAADRQRALGAGYQLQLTKPIDPEQLISAVRALVGR